MNKDNRSEFFQILCDRHLKSCLILHLLKSSLFCYLRQNQLPVDVLEHRQLSYHLVDYPLGCKRQFAFWQQFVRYLSIFAFGWVLHQYHHLRVTGDQVHGSSHSLHHLPWNDPVGYVAVFAYLHSSKHGHVEMSTPNDGERLRWWEIWSSRVEGDSFLNK